MSRLRHPYQQFLLLLCAGLIATSFVTWTTHLNLASAAAAQASTRTAPDDVWQEPAARAQKAAPDVPAGARAVRLNTVALERLLRRAPHESQQSLANSTAILGLPMPDGTYQRFRLEESSVLEPELAARFPEIKSYRGQGVDNPLMTMRGDWTPQGFHALILSNDATITIHPAELIKGVDAAQNYVSYFGMSKAAAVSNFQCFVNDKFNIRPGDTRRLQTNTAVGPTRREYRLAVATTGEYSTLYGGGTVGGTVASINTWLNGLNAIYEREVALRLILVNDTDAIYLDGGTDPYTNGNTTTMLNEVRPDLNAKVGAGNFDIGHVLGTGGGGIAFVGVTCNNDDNEDDNLGPVKGGGVSLVSGTLGNSSSLNIFAHEVGHQFGANHTFNTTASNCGGSGRSANSAVETGAGLTIMSYAGICAPDNIVGNAELRFHTHSYTQITNYVSSGGGNGCGTTSATSNTAPTVDGGANFTIPKQTPFTLTATGSDSDSGDTANLTFVWEQVDAGGATFINPPYSDAGDASNSTRPIFRPFSPTPSTSRTFPALNYILNNSNTPPATINDFQTAENLPAIGRLLNFRVTARDQRGGVNDDAVQLTVVDNAGPFLITSPVFSEVWTGGTNRTITWSVNGTNAAPINAANVRILLSTNGGQTFPIELLSSTPNDGSQSITVPQGIVTQTARIKVQAIGNIFFDINDTNLTISPGDACPAVGSLSPLVNQVGASVLITGINFDSVSDVRFSPNISAPFIVLASSVISATVPEGAISGPITLVQLGCPNVQTAFFTVCPNPPVTLQVDDNSLENALGFPSGATSVFVNRLTPASYPATLSAVIPAINLPVGTAVEIVYGANADGDNNISGTSFQSLNASVTQQAAFTTFNVAPLTINAGDFVVGFRVSPVPGQFPATLDTSSVSAQRSYLSNDGTNFSTFDANGNPGNLGVRALVFTGNCNSGPACPTVSGISPTDGGIGATVTITGTNLLGITGVKFSNNVNAQFTVVNATTVMATVPSGASTGPLTISKGGCPDVMTQSFTVNCPSITLTPPTLPAGTVGAIYGQSLTATGGTAPYTFAVAAGNLPTGITLSAGGTLSGTPLVTGTFNFTARATDNTGCAGTLAFTLTIACQSITVNPATLPAGTVNAPYSQTLSQVGGIGNVTWAVSAGALPTGISLSSAGVLAGTTTQKGTFNFTAQVTDANGCTGTRAYELTINCQTITVNPATLSGAVVNQPFSQTFSHVGGAGAVTWALTGTTPPGLNFNPTTGVLSGTPTQVGSSNFTITVTDANTCTGMRSYTLVVDPCTPLTINPTTLPTAPLKQSYSQTVTATGGTGPYTFAIIAGALPDGLMFSEGGVLSGTATVSGNFNFTVRGTDSANCTGERAYTLQVGCPAITVNPATLPDGTQGSAYNQTLTATGGNGPYVFAVVNGSGSLPPGINLAANGALSGTPTQAGSFSFTVSATEAGGCLGTRAYTLNITSACPSLTLNPATLPAGTTGLAYSQSFTVTGGTSPYSFSLDAGALPLGLFLTSGGQLTGTPQQSGPFNFTVRANDAKNCPVMRSYTLTINCSTLTVNPPTLPAARLNHAYNQQLSAAGATGAILWNLDSGNLPPGLTLAPTGLLSGTATTLGSFTFTVKALDSAGCMSTRAYTLNVLRGMVKADFDGDGISDLSVWRPANGTWYTRNSSDTVLQTVPWGAGYAPYFDVIVPGDYDGDGKTDQAIWRGQDSIWYIRKSSNGEAILDLWGANYAPYFDIPTPGDFDGDGKTDIAVWRRDGTWFVKRSSDGGFTVQSHGQDGDIPVAADYDGDGKTDFAVFRPSVLAPTPNWLILNSSTNTVNSILWGAGYAPYFDTPVPADYDGDGKADLAIWRGQDSIWYVRKSSDSAFILQPWGAIYAPYFDIPTPGDYDGDGKADFAVWRRDGTWFVIRSSNGSFLIQGNGQNGDVPVPAR